MFGQPTPLSGEAREALISEANRHRAAEQYDAAVGKLNIILSANSSDAPILLFKGDLLLQGKHYREAAETYTKLLPLKYETTIATINLSYALFMNHKPAKALQFARAAWEGNKRHPQAVVNYFNALLWNIKTREAGRFLEQQDSLLTSAQQLVLKARLYTTSGNYEAGLKYYDSLVKTYPDKYYVQEYAEVLLGKKDMENSANTMKSSKMLFSENEFRNYEQKLKASRQQNAGTEMNYFTDIAGNVRIENSVWWQQSEQKKYRFRLSAGHSSITSADGGKTTTQFGHVTIAERWSKAWTGETDLHLQVINAAGSNNFSAVTGQQLVKYQPNDRRMIGVFYSTDILNFTAGLLGNNIRSNNAGYITHLMLNGKNGFYSQGSMGMLSDKNKRLLFFGSLYHLFRTEPTVKTGVNFSALHFSDSSIKNYFSPNRYLSTEVFADYSTALPLLSKFYLQAQAAAGIQQIEKQNWDPAYRFQAEIGFRLKQLEGALKYQTSNVAAGNGTGYQFNWFTFRMLWKW